MALGPMSTPLRSWPRSMGTPKSPTGSRSFSDKGSPSRTSWIGRRLEASAWRPPDGVDPAEKHVGGLIAEHLLVAVETGRAGAGLVGNDGGAHARDQTFPRLEGVEPPGIELRLTETVVHRDACTGNDEPRAVAHARGDGDSEAIVVDAREMRGMGRTEGGEDPTPLLGRVLLSGQPL